MGSRVVNSCPVPPTYDVELFEQQPTNTTPVGPSCPQGESEPGAGLTPTDEANAHSSSATTLPPFPVDDPLFKSAFGPLLEGSDSKLPVCTREATHEAEPADEKAVRAALGEAGVRDYRDMKNDLAEAHRVYEATGQIPQTRHSFAWIEIQTGRIMTQAQRYDAFMEKIGKNPRDVVFYEKDVKVDLTYMTAEEFHTQHMARIKEVQQELHDTCHTGAMRFQPLAQPDCERAIFERNANPAFIAERDEADRKGHEGYQYAKQHIEEVGNSGAVSTLARAGGRAVGYGIGYATGGPERAERWADKCEAYAGAVGGLGDAALPVIAGRSEMARAEAYQGSSGLEVRREVPAHVESTPGNNPQETQPDSAHESYAESKSQGAGVQNNKQAGAAGGPPLPNSPSSAPRGFLDTNTAIHLESARQKGGQNLTPIEQRLFNEFKDKDVWVVPYTTTELEFKQQTKEEFKVATDVKPSTKQERDAINNDLLSASVGGGEKKGEKDRTEIRQILLMATPPGKSNTLSTADDGVAKGLFRLAHIPDPRPGHIGEFLDPAKLDGKSVRDFLRDVLKQETFDVTVQGHRLTVRPL